LENRPKVKIRGENTEFAHVQLCLVSNRKSQIANRNCPESDCLILAAYAAFEGKDALAQVAAIWGQPVPLLLYYLFEPPGRVF
jgi:hypothetical protein